MLEILFFYFRVVLFSFLWCAWRTSSAHFCDFLFSLLFVVEHCFEFIQIKMLLIYSKWMLKKISKLHVKNVINDSKTCWQIDLWIKRKFYSFKFVMKIQKLKVHPKKRNCAMVYLHNKDTNSFTRNLFMEIN